jgi:hypothetical protein
MSHTTVLSNNWIAIHDSDPGIVLFRKLNNKDNEEVAEKEAEIPYSVMREFVAEQVRRVKISALEKSTIDFLLLGSHGPSCFEE